jgi:hypothetical protein
LKRNLTITLFVLLGSLAFGQAPYPTTPKTQNFHNSVVSNAAPCTQSFGYFISGDSVETIFPSATYPYHQVVICSMTVSYSTGATSQAIFQLETSLSFNPCVVGPRNPFLTLQVTQQATNLPQYGGNLGYWFTVPAGFNVCLETDGMGTASAWYFFTYEYE